MLRNALKSLRIPTHFGVREPMLRSPGAFAAPRLPRGRQPSSSPQKGHFYCHLNSFYIKTKRNFIPLKWRLPARWGEFPGVISSRARRVSTSLSLGRVRRILKKTQKTGNKEGEGRGILLFLSVGAGRMLLLPAREEWDVKTWLDGCRGHRLYHPAAKLGADEGKGPRRGIGSVESSPPASPHLRQVRASSRRGGAPRKTPAIRSLPRSGGRGWGSGVYPGGEAGGVGGPPS